jgi:Tfp pilus assembly protein PilF
MWRLVRPAGAKLAAIFAILFIAARVASAGEIDCGALENAYGPYDYTNPDHRKNKIPIVEGAHFYHEVESLTSATLGSVYGNLDYTLRAVPNHHRALMAVARYQLQGGDTTGFRSAECYFDRAMRFKPDDGTVYLVYGIYLAKKKDFKGAEEAYLRATELLPESPEPTYNLGLLYVDTAQLDKAKERAIKAYSLGYPLDGLRNKLKRLGKWDTKDDAAVAAARVASRPTQATPDAALHK